MTIKTPLLVAESISRSFGDFTANDAVSLTINEGEIHALLGENGAGKSTFVKMLYGVLQPDDGRLLWRGDDVEITSPRLARSMGIAMVFQHFSLFPALSVLENIAIALEPEKGQKGEGLDALRARIMAESQRRGLDINPDRPVGRLSVGEKQRVEILRCLLQNPRLLIMDEPTSVLTPQEIDQLFVVLRQLPADGCAILYISHKLNEVITLADTATVLRGGRNVGRTTPKQSSTRALAEMMVGGGIDHVERRPDTRTDNSDKLSAEIRLSINGLERPASHDFATALSGISLELRAGEILGIAGVSGNGQGELAEALSGEWRCPGPGVIMLGNTDIGQLGPSARRQHGIEAVPEERNGHAAIPEMALSSNTFLTRFHHYQQQGPFWKRLMASPMAASPDTASIIRGNDVRVPEDDPLASQLSGGNLQKFILGRMLLANPRVAVVVQPTWGVDVGAASLIRRQLLSLAESGCAIILISQDLEEILALASHITVLHGGRLSAVKPAGEMTVEAIGLLMGGETAA